MSNVGDVFLVVLSTFCRLNWIYFCCNYKAMLSVNVHVFIQSVYDCVCFMTTNKNLPLYPINISSIVFFTLLVWFSRTSTGLSFSCAPVRLDLLMLFMYQHFSALAPLQYMFSCPANTYKLDTDVGSSVGLLSSTITLSNTYKIVFLYVYYKKININIY